VFSVDLITIVWKNVGRDNPCRGKSSKKEARSKGHFPKKNRENDKKGLWFQDKNKNFCTHCGKSGHWIEKCWTLHPQLCLKQNQEDVKALTRRQVATSAEVDSLAEKFEKELFLWLVLVV
jgi:hypothetical protein